MNQEPTITLNPTVAEQAENYNITADAVMPDIRVDSIIENVQSRDILLRVWATLSIIYAQNGRNDQWMAEVELLKQAAQQRIPIAVPDVRGGKLSVQSFATIKLHVGGTVTIKSNVTTCTIAATQPLKKNIRLLLKPDYLHAVVFKRSAFEQFVADGQPSVDKGFGMHRISNPTVAEIWNWKANAAAAKADFDARKAAAVAYPAQLRAQQPDYYNGLPNFSTAGAEKQALQSYGTGSYYKPKKNLLGSWKWELDTNDGYADSCIKLLQDVANNKPPVGWD